MGGLGAGVAEGTQSSACYQSSRGSRLAGLGFQGLGKYEPALASARLSDRPQGSPKGKVAVLGGFISAFRALGFQGNPNPETLEV